MSNPNPQNQFEKGKSGNPNGRPKRDWTVQGLIELAMEEESETGIPYKKIVYTKLVSMAKAGDIQAIKEINNRLDGMPKQTTELTGADGKDIVVKIVEDTELKDANRPTD